jgi:hypothetical protein
LLALGASSGPGRHSYGWCQQAVEERLYELNEKNEAEGTPTSVANARAAVEELGVPIRLSEPAGEVGASWGMPRRAIHPRLPGLHGEAPKGGLAGGGLVDGYVFGSREVPASGESKPQFRQQSGIEVEEALCNQATGEDCGI